MPTLKGPEATSGRRELGEELRRLRQELNYSGNAVALKLGWSPSRISRLEHGLTGVSTALLAALLAFYRVREDAFIRLFELNRVALDHSRMRPHPELLLDQVRLASLHEASATRVTEYDPLAIPTLLQTAEYAHALRDTDEPATSEDVDLQRTALTQRQTILRRPSPTFRFFIAEHVLRAPIGNQHIMGTQLHHLLKATARHQLTLRILPASTGPSREFGSAFRILQYDGSRDVACLHTPTAWLFHEKPEDVAVYRTILDRLNRLSLDTAQSMQLINDVANTYIGTTEPLPLSITQANTTMVRQVWGGEQ